MLVKEKLAEIDKKLEACYDIPDFNQYYEAHTKLINERYKILSMCNHKVVEIPEDKTDLVQCAKCEEHFWFCPDSPNHVCKYDDKKDPAHDNCLYCKKPEERK